MYIMINGIGAHIKVKNFKDSVAFYGALGFQKVFEYGPGTAIDEDYNGMVFEHNGCKLEIANGHRAVKSAVFQEDIQSSKISLMINVDSIDDIMAKCKIANIPLAVGPRHYYWGSIEMVLKDPDGTVLVFICPYSEEEAKKVAADEAFAVKK